MLGDRRRILVAEDNWVIAQDIAAALTEMGYAVIGPAATLAQARRLGADDIDGAVLDLRLGDGTAIVFALELARRGKRVLVISGAGLPNELADLDGLQKPFGTRDLEAALAAALGPARA